MTESAQNREFPPGQDLFGADWPEDPRLLGEPTESGPETGGAPPAMRQESLLPEATFGPEYEPVRSSVKVTRNAKGAAQWDIRVMEGDSEDRITAAREIAVRQYKALERELQ